MKREQLFSEGGYYPFIVNSNSLMHKEAVTLGIKALTYWLKNNPIEHIRVLDLACGGIPISAIEIMAAFPHINFEYTGIDINPDQVYHAQSISFPKHVTQVNIIEGNAWNLQGFNEPFDIIFSGMNFHHGTADELYSLAHQLNDILHKDGFIFSHDEYRPPLAQYILRPSKNPQQSDESFRLIEETDLKNIPDLDMTPVSFNKETKDWRSLFIKKIGLYLRQHNAKDEYIEQTQNHIYTRDFPVSVPEISRIFSMANLQATELQANTEHDLIDFFAFLVFEKAS